MSKYSALWEYVQSNKSQSFKLTFEEIEKIAGIPIDHSFLKYKKELTKYGYQVGKISMILTLCCMTARICRSFRRSQTRGVLRNTAGAECILPRPSTMII